MSTLREAAQQALEAVEQDNPAGRSATITALRAALAQQEQEPVLTMNKMGSLVECSPTVRAFDLSDGECKLYTHPPRRETEQEPVAWIQPDHLQKARQAPFLCRVEPTKRRSDFMPIFTHPPRREWQGLKEWEINDGRDQLPTEDLCNWSFRKGVYFAEAKLKEKNHE